MNLSAPKRLPHESSPSEKGVLVYNGRSYAVGLLWFTVQEENAKDLLKQRISKSKADFYCPRTHVSQQQGFGWLHKNHRRGMQAAAAMIADQLVGEWHGVFEAENGWWYVQVRSDTITPNGDRFFTSEEEAYNLFQEEAVKNIWPHSYAPEKWHINESNTRELKLGNFLDGLSNTVLMPANLTASFGSTAVRNMVFGALLFVFILMVFVAVKTLFVEPVPIPQSPVPMRVVANPSTPKLAEPNQSVSPQQLLQQCGEAADQLYIGIPGWISKSFTCAPGKASMAWQQNSGTLSSAKTIGMSLWPKTASVNFLNRILTVNLSLGNLPKLERSELVPQETALLYLEQNMQPLGALQVKPVIPPAPPVQNNAAANPNAPPPVPKPSYLDINFTTGFGPEKIAPLLSAPALEMTQLLWDVTQAKWEYKLKWTIQAIKPATTAKPNTPANKAVPATGVK